MQGDFPFSRGFLPVVLSWFFSPIIAGCLSAIIFNINRFAILRRKNSTMLAIYSLPILIFFTFWINIMVGRWRVMGILKAVLLIQNHSTSGMVDPHKLFQ
jgi:phosphate/sulfate permease